MDEGVLLTAMAIRPSEPKFMKVGILTAALQELPPRDVRAPDPDRGVVEFARELGPTTSSCQRRCIPTSRSRRRQCSSGRNTLDLRKPFDKERAARVKLVLQGNKVGLSDVGYFDNLLHHDPAVRQKKHDFMLRTFDAAVLLGVDAVCGFVGRNSQHTMDENLIDFEAWFIPSRRRRERAQLSRGAGPDAGLDHGDICTKNIA